ncbi:MAG: polysaccharide deacetylase family protein [Deltaproteobacteria bacterium]|nr:polysaccharide deacetylase family protein [Deltaproteobacteria bacterium]
MRRLPLPGWVLAGSVTVFALSWLLAPGHTLSGLRRVTGAPATPRSPRVPPVVRYAPPPSASAEDPAPQEARIYGFLRTHRVALTFDDGPHPVQTTRLLGILERFGATGAFFVNGYWLEQGRPDAEASRAVLQRAHAAGHVIGNHTYSHVPLHRLSPDEQTWQIVANEVLISSIIGERPTLFRPPYGSMTRHATRVLAQYGYVDARWNAAAVDEEVRSARSIADTLLAWLRANRGGIVLLHDRLPHSVGAVELLLRALDDENCARLSRSEPTFQVVSLDSFRRGAAQSLALADQAATERQRHGERLRKLCPR